MSTIDDVPETDNPPGDYTIRIAGETDGSGDRIPDLSPREALERWLGKLRVSKADSTVSAYHYRLKLFVEFCEAQEIDHVGDLTGWDLETYETHRRESVDSALTLKRDLGALRLFLQYLAKIEQVNESLPEKVDLPDVPRKAHVDETRLHADDARALLDYYMEHPTKRASRSHVLLALLWYTGARLGGVRALDVDDFEPGEEYVEFHHRPEEDTPLKNGVDGERIVGLPAEIAAVVEDYVDGDRLDTYDDHGRRPLLTTQYGRASKNGIRTWTYLATQPCLHSPCPHGNERETCEYVNTDAASKCPSSRSPHQVRTGSITWQLNQGVPPQVVADRVNTSVAVLKRHYDKPTKKEEMEERRREHLDRLSFEEGGVSE